jgi:hypothetical protein
MALALPDLTAALSAGRDLAPAEAATAALGHGRRRRHGCG